MKHVATARFWRLYEGLPKNVQRLADKCFDLLRSSPRHPALHFKKIGRLWSARVGAHYRVLAYEEDGTLVWFGSAATTTTTAFFLEGERD